ncbi:hypothetical protein N7462_010751 [Penicillium macrosclerotiorum]|uniref:uncharacterized protein n=1 Tax=Penicillium macrosclerotiorum TaxID=303699 RepID=UPI00254798D9|nr:uncharacterized protein N7462_010751 [Penicillium macrosclerotiorum]KAJ5669681.1 hypothetical protein N7462_010751 [Penicillium macrosclerotiorum]
MEGSKTDSFISSAATPTVHQCGGNARPASYGAFTAFQPRSVASSQPQPQPYRTHSPVVSAPPTTAAGYATPANTYTNYYQQPQSYQSGPSYYGARGTQGAQGGQYPENTYGSTVPQIQNPFGPNQAYGPRPGPSSGLDPDTEAQIAQWQSAYATPSEESSGKPGREGPSVVTPSTGPAGTGTPVPQPEPQSTVVRSGGGQTWNDSSLLEWDPAHFRLFVGNLAGEVTDDSLLKAFARYSSVQKARVIREKRTQKSKGYGFISFSDGDDYFKAAREMQGKYIGSHPVLLRRAQTEVRPVSSNKNQKKNGGSRGGPPGGKVKQDGVKKPGKTKGGLKILG